MSKLRVLVIAALTACLIVASVAVAEETQGIRASEVEILKARVDGLEETVRNLIEVVETKEVKAAGKCRWVEECTYVYCCKWGSTGNGGTAKCLEQCCGATRLVYKCD